MSRIGLHRQSPDSAVALARRVLEVTDAGLAGFSLLRHVALRGTLVKELVSFGNLVYADLANTLVHDASVERLCERNAGLEAGGGTKIRGRTAGAARATWQDHVCLFLRREGRVLYVAVASAFRLPLAPRLVL